ncbi:DUF1146 family protein [Lactobacillus psittaci]|uniref:DUF1146 domain-containing protein n=1 Tax=Lactobacillus psittaci DSM 15354 TaxID=1122152 RepID=A0A0R1S7D6_9LACO|nr:DUF1146 family protein [Lactobacillus psittaci]KRL63444.1 hypothetical protein FC23_GL000685 [Lactobacillus psittaci DSM 15354]
MQQVGVHALLALVIYFLMIALAFRAVRALDISKFLKIKGIFEAQILYNFISIALGYLVAQFIISFMDYSTTLTNLF